MKLNDWNWQPPYDFEKGACLLVDKPLNYTSFDVVHKLRNAIQKKLKIKNLKVGHGGTLDPLATGLLLICTGTFTKRLDSLLGLEKAYTGTITLGQTTPSYDGETVVNQTFDTQHLTETLLEQVRLGFMGEISQIPPIYSAVKKNGKPAYESARAGEEIEIPARQVKIHEFSLSNFQPSINEGAATVDFYCHCSKGTYIRSLANDFGKAAQSGAWLSALRRVKVGEIFEVKNAWQLDPLIEFIQNF